MRAGIIRADNLERNVPTTFSAQKLAMVSIGGDIERDGKRNSVIDQHGSSGFADLFCGQLKRGEESPEDSYGRLEDADHARIVERHVISNPVPGGTVQVQ